MAGFFSFVFIKTIFLILLYRLQRFLNETYHEKYVNCRNENRACIGD